MKRYFGFVLFHVVFFSLMWMSKTVHVIFFDDHHAVLNFGLSYSAMALAGYFSFFAGHAADVYGFARMVSVGSLLYGVGLTLRIFPDSVVLALLSGGAAGVGASFCLSALRIWMVSLSDKDTTSKLVGLKGSSTALGTAIGCMSVGLLPFSSRDILLYCGLAMIVVGVLFALKTKRSTNVVIAKPVKSPWQGLSKLFRQHRGLAIVTSVLGLATGLYVSFIGPYLPLLLKDKGLSLSAIGLSTGAFALVRFVADPLIANAVGKMKNQSLWIFVGAELLIAIATASFLLPISKTGFVLLLLMRSLSLAFSAITEELLWLRVFPAESIGLFFGLNQSAYFAGDFLGGLVNGYVYKAFGLATSIQVVLVVMLVNSALFFRLMSKTLSRQAAPTGQTIVC